MQALQIARPSTASVQGQLSLVLAAPVAEFNDPVGTQLGADHARHGVTLPAGHLHEGSPLFAGWQAAAARPRHGADPAPGVRAWLQLRLQAWSEGRDYELQRLTPHFLQQLERSHCPVSRKRLQDEDGHPQQRRWVRLRQDAAYAAGHLAQLGATAARALQGRRHAELQALAEQSARLGQPLEGLTSAAWARLAALVAYVTPLPGDCRALAALPTNRLHLLNAPQALQAWVTRQLASPGWSQRLALLHDALPGVPARQAVRHLVVLLSARALLLPAEPLARQAALEDLWLDARIAERWQALLSPLSPLTLERLLRQLPAPTGVAMERHGGEMAVAGW